jgi:methylase of polypeptide subunit release factors
LTESLLVTILIVSDLQHHIYALLYDGALHRVVFDKDKPVHRVLDVGTGTGIWAIDYGMYYYLIVVQSS